MTIDKIFQYILDLYRKDGKGNSLQPTAFNNWMQFESLGMFNDLMTQAESLAAQGNINVSEVIFKMSLLGNFIKDTVLTPAQSTLGNFTIGTAVIPADCKLPLGLLAKLRFKTISDNPIAEYTYSSNTIVTQKSPLLKTKYRGSVLNGDVANNPIFFTENGRIEFLPNDLSSLVLTYLRTPAVPYYDYSMDSADNMVFMPAKSFLIYVSATNDYEMLIDVAGSSQLLASGLLNSNADPTATPAYTSLTTELDWDETQHIKLANLVAEKLGINLRINTGQK